MVSCSEGGLEDGALYLRRVLDLSTLPALSSRQVTALRDEQLRRQQVLDTP